MVHGRLCFFCKISMKKIVILWSLASAVLMACGPNNDKLIDQYEKAMKAENYSEAREILSHIDEDKLTEQQSARILDVTTGGAFGTIEERLLEGLSKFGGALNEAMSDDLADRTEEAAEALLDDVLDVYSDALDEVLAGDK